MQTFALRRNRTRPPMVLPAVCLAGIEPEPPPSPPQAWRTASPPPPRWRLSSSPPWGPPNPPRGPLCPPLQRRKWSPPWELQLPRWQEPLKNTATSSPPFLLCLVCSTCSSEKKTVVFSAKRGLMRTILSCRGGDISQTTSVQDQHTPSQGECPNMYNGSMFCIFERKVNNSPFQPSLLALEPLSLPWPDRYFLFEIGTYDMQNCHICQIKTEFNCFSLLIWHAKLSHMTCKIVTYVTILSHMTSKIVTYDMQSCHIWHVKLSHICHDIVTYVKWRQNLIVFLCAQGKQAFATFPTLPCCLQVLRKEISNNTVSEENSREKKRNQRIKDHQEKPSRRLYPSIIRVKHQL